MSVTTVINTVFFLFAVLGAADYLLDNRFGLGSQFERGICCCGKLIIAMTGFMTLAPALGRLLSPLVTPLFATVGADPSALAGMLLANDSGGAVLAAEMALDAAAGEFNGYFVASMLGATVMCIIPMSMLSVGGARRSAAMYGVLIGLLTVPVGCMAGGLLAGYAPGMLARNLIPATALSLALAILLGFFSQQLLRPFQIFGKCLVGVSLAGLLVTAAGVLLPVELPESLTPFSQIIPVIGNIALTLSGVFPLLQVVSRLIRVPLRRAAALLKIGQQDMTGLLVSAVNIFPTFDMLSDMTPRGILLNTAFMVGANCMLGDHFAFTAQMRPALAGPVIAAKALSGLLALAVGAVLAQRLVQETSGLNLVQAGE